MAHETVGETVNETVALEAALKRYAVPHRHLWALDTSSGGTVYEVVFTVDAEGSSERYLGIPFVGGVGDAEAEAEAINQWASTVAMACKVLGWLA